MARILMVAFKVLSLACISLAYHPVPKKGYYEEYTPSAGKPCCGSWSQAESDVRQYESCDWYGTASWCAGQCPEHTVYIEEASSSSAATYYGFDLNSIKVRAPP